MVFGIQSDLLLPTIQFLKFCVFSHGIKFNANLNNKIYYRKTLHINKVTVFTSLSGFQSESNVSREHATF